MKSVQMSVWVFNEWLTRRFKSSKNQFIYNSSCVDTKIYTYVQSLILQFDIQISNSIPQTIYQSQDHTKNPQYSTDILITGHTGNTLKIYKSSTDILSSQEPTSKTT